MVNEGGDHHGGAAVLRVDHDGLVEGVVDVARSSESEGDAVVNDLVDFQVLRSLPAGPGSQTGVIGWGRPTRMKNRANDCERYST